MSSRFALTVLLSLVVLQLALALELVATADCPNNCWVVAPVVGPTGPAGQIGERGERGVQGFPGVDGRNGTQGIKGDAGPRGEKGDKGDTGERGLQGVAGIKGANGIDGRNGTQGVKGDTGSIGPQGPKGDTGATGPQGLKGDVGPIGATGIKGDKGDKGDQGIQGIQGIQGPTGATGATGATGTFNPLTTLVNPTLVRPGVTYNLTVSEGGLVISNPLFPAGPQQSVLDHYEYYRMSAAVKGNFVFEFEMEFVRIGKVVTLALPNVQKGGIAVSKIELNTADPYGPIPARFRPKEILSGGAPTPRTFIVFGMVNVKIVPLHLMVYSDGRMNCWDGSGTTLQDFPTTTYDIIPNGWFATTLQWVTA